MFQFFGLAKTSSTKNIPTSLIFFFIYFFNQEKRHGHLATVKLDKQYPLLGDRIYFEFFEKEIWIIVANYRWVDVTCCQWTQELIDSVWSRILSWYDIVYQKGVFISEGMDRIQSLTSGEKRPQWPFSAFTKLNSKKIIYSIQRLENRYCISANKRPRHLFNFEALKCGT